ncbi:MAG TPA: DUF2339 domain-containing protein [Acidobacteriaceae bacterium]|jgi:uncharacterized membrane protein|nr:DUF2339 domain-containing protein [Acidobacteriaceae bacterium]
MNEGPERSPAEERAQRLEAALAAVTARVFQLEQEVAALRGHPPPAASVPAAGEVNVDARFQGVAQPTAPIDASVGPATAEAFAPLPAAASAPIAPTRVREERSVESRLGSQWFNRIGIIALLIGVALFLKFAFDNHWVGPAGRVLIGLLSGAALIAWSERFRSKGYTAFSYSLKAVGSGVLYLSLWAAFSMYHLIPGGVAFAGMVVVTGFNAFIAWRQSAELLAVYAIVGAFSTPLLLSTGRDEEVFLFCYLLMMNAATMALLVLRGWNRLLVLSFVGTVAFYWGWYWQFYTPAAFVTTTVLLSLFILLFAAATIFARHRRDHPEQDDVARALVSLANAAFGFLGFYAMLSQNGSGRNTALAWCSVGFGAFYLGVRKWMERTPIAGSRLAALTSLSDIQLSIAIVFLTLAVPLAVHGHWVTVGWMAEGAVLVWVATRVRSTLMQFLATGALSLGLISLAMDATIAQTRVVWNTRLLSFAVSIAATAVVTVLARGEANREEASKSAGRWERLAQAGAVIAHALVIVAVLLEIHTYWWSGPPPAAGAVDLRTPGSLLSSAIWLMAASGAIVLVGVRGKPGMQRFAGRQDLVSMVETICWAAFGLIVLFMGMVYPQPEVIWNLRFAAFAVAVAATMWAARQVQGRSAQLHIGASVLATVLALTAICFEISTFWSTRPLLAAPGSVMYASQVAGRQMAERFSYSAWFLLAGAALLVLGFRRRSALLRWQGLVLLAVTICKVFLLDTSTLSQGYRIVSFLALGALLLAVSFAYQRDWLHLRAAGATDGGELK